MSRTPERAQNDDRITPERALSTSRDLVAQFMARMGLETIRGTGPEPFRA